MFGEIEKTSRLDDLCDYFGDGYVSGKIDLPAGGIKIFCN